MQKTLDILAICVGSAAVFTIINLIHFNFFVVDVVFYACLFDLFFTLIAVGPIAYLFAKKRGHLSKTETILTGLLVTVSLIFYSVIGPTVIDRSLSFYIVEKLRQRGGAIAYDAFPEIFVKEYMPEYRLMDVRLTEQFNSGFAEKDGSCVVLTDKGRLVAAFMDFYRRNLLPKKRNLLGTVTDRLTHPFDDAPQVVDVTCQRASQRSMDDTVRQGPSPP
jgi:hypothetical protein